MGKGMVHRHEHGVNALEEADILAAFRFAFSQGDDVRTLKPNAAASRMSAARTWRMPVMSTEGKSISVPNARLERMDSLWAASMPSMSNVGSASA